MTRSPSVPRRAAPDGDVAALVVAVAGLRPDVGAGERDLGGPSGRRARPARANVRGPPRRIDGRLDRDADRIAVVVDEGQDLRTDRSRASSRPCCGVERRRARVARRSVARHHAAAVPAVADDRRRRGVAVGPVERPARRDLDQRPLEEQRQGDPRLEEVTIDGSFFSQIGSSRSQPPCGSSSITRASPWIVARSVRPPTAIGSVIESATFGLRLDVLELAREQRRRGQVDPLAVVERDQRIGDRAAASRRRRSARRRGPPRAAARRAPGRVDIGWLLARSFVLLHVSTFCSATEIASGNCRLPSTGGRMIPRHWLRAEGEEGARAAPRPPRRHLRS